MYKSGIGNHDTPGILHQKWVSSVGKSSTIYIFTLWRAMLKSVQDSISELCNLLGEMRIDQY